MGSLLRVLPSGVTITTLPISEYTSGNDNRGRRNDKFEQRPRRKRSVTQTQSFSTQRGSNIGFFNGAGEKDNGQNYEVDIDELEEIQSSVMTPDFCLSSFDEKSMITSSSSNTSTIHSKTQSSNCPHCDESILKKELSSHLKEHVFNNTVNYSRLKQNILQRWEDVEEEGSSSSLAYIAEEIQTNGRVCDRERISNQPYFCEQCSSVFTKALDLESHLQSHEPDGNFQCQICLKSFRKESILQKHERIHNGTAPHACTLCSKTFNQRVHLRAHLRKHNGEKPYKCKFCPKEYSDSSSLVYHERTHTGEKPFKCPYCPKAFYKSGGLKGHLAIHLRNEDLDGSVEDTETLDDRNELLDDSKKFPSCQYCNKMFGTYTAVIQHEKTHIGLRNFSCSICSQIFSQVGHLMTHVKLKHGAGKGEKSNIEQEKKFICARCSQKFIDIASLNQHKLDYHSYD